MIKSTLFYIAGFILWAVSNYLIIRGWIKINRIGWKYGLTTNYFFTSRHHEKQGEISKEIRKPKRMVIAGFILFIGGALLMVLIGYFTA